MSDPTLEVLVFSSANLFRALSNTHCTPNEVAAKKRSQYLLSYLADIGAKTIVVEYEYTDGDYLEDFASFYVRCYEEYPRRCKRLHFFSETFDEKTLRRVLLSDLPVDQYATIVDSYLGFVVARPLPSAIIGRTIIKTYSPDGNRRHYPVTRNYSAHLFGTTLRVRSLPYQEQDSVLAACATVALWCAFHKTAQLFGTASPRPATITRAANRFGHRGRSVPSHGLNVEEMCHAISDVGLEPELVVCEGRDVPWVSLAYSHLAMGLPVILGVRIGGGALHAITLTGYSLRDHRVHVEELTVGGSAVPMVGLRIDELYGHDDQICPFARLKIGAAGSTHPVLLTGSWIDKTGKPLELHPYVILIPVYNKIRVTFLDVQEWLIRLSRAWSVLVADPKKEYEWDIQLTTTNEFKASLNAGLLSQTEREQLLLEQQPRFLWKAVLRVTGKDAVEILFDATDMARSFPIRSVIWHHSSFRAAVTTLLTAPVTQAALADHLTPRFLDFLKRTL